MKYALLFILLFVANLSTEISAQPDQEEDGFYYSSGTVYNGDQLTGYFTLQIGKVDDEVEKYTLKLLDRNADQIGKTVYQRKNEFDFQRITYNGTYLALQLKEEDNPAYIDLIDGDGGRVTRKTFDHLKDARVTNLWPVESGFVYVVSYEVNPIKENDQRRWRIGLLSNDDGEMKWEVQSKNPPRTKHYVDFLDADEEMMLFAVSELDFRKRKVEGLVGLMSIDISSGEILFTHDLPQGDAWANSNFTAANITREGITALQHYDVANNRNYSISHYDRSGRRISKHHLSMKEQMLKDLGKKEKRAYRSHYWMVSDHQFTADGQLQMAVQNFRPSGTNLNFFSPQTVIIDTTGQLIAKEMADTREFMIKSKFLGLVGTPIMSRKGKGMMQDIQFHGGPLAYAGQQKADDITIQYYFDREFTKEGVNYESIHAIYYLDGELIEEVIPFESDADMVRIYPGKPGYFLVMEAYSDGSINTRLERMDF